MLFIILLVIIVCILFGCAKVIPQNHVGMVSLWGKCINPNNPWPAGLHFKIPVVEQITVVDLAQGNVELSDSPIKITTSDQALAYANVALTYHVDNAYAYTWGAQHPVDSMRQKVQSMLRDIIGGMKLTEALNHNEEIQAELQKRISQATNMYGLHVDQVNIEQLQASDEMQQHMDEQKRSQLDKVSKENEANGDAQKITITNKADNDATINTATAKAKAIEKMADAKQYSIKAVKDILGEVGSNPALATAYFNYLSINAEAKLAHAGNLVFDNSQLNHFGQIPKMAVMQKVWHDEQNHENHPDTHTSSDVDENDSDDNIPSDTKPFNDVPSDSSSFSNVNINNNDDNNKNN